MLTWIGSPLSRLTEVLGVNEFVVETLVTSMPPESW